MLQERCNTGELKECPEEIRGSVDIRAFELCAHITTAPRSESAATQSVGRENRGR